jgi:hypothetical protein
MKEPASRFESAESLVEQLDRAQLAAPEIPLGIRLFAQEVGTLGLVVAFFLIISWFMYQAAAENESRTIFDSLLPLLVMLGVVITRVMQAGSEARRLAMAGFSVADVMKGMHAVVDEREVMREQLRPNVDVQKRRRWTVRMALAQIVASVVLFWWALQLRVQVGPRSYDVGIGATTMVITSLILVGVSLVLLIRSPFRMPPGERMFRMIWLGGFGRWFLRRAARGIKPSATASTGSTGASAVAVATQVVVEKAQSNGTTIGDLDRRVRDLEEWRRSLKR